MPSAGPAVVAWLEHFEAGALTDPALIDGTLDPAERFAARLPGLTAVQLAPGHPRPKVTAIGPTGTALVTDTRLLLLGDTGPGREWRWDQVADLRFIMDSAGVMLLPTPERFASGAGLEGLVDPWFARGEPAPAETSSRAILGWWAIEGAWRSSRPGGLAAWRQELAAVFPELAGGEG